MCKNNTTHTALLQHGWIIVCNKLGAYNKKGKQNEETSQT